MGISKRFASEDFVTTQINLIEKEIDAVSTEINNIDIPANVSDLNNDSGFITRTVQNLANYYLKSETYSQDEVNAKLSAIPKFAIQPVDTLPTSNISVTTVYLLKSGEESQNLYTEYIYVNNTWEYLGAQTVDLSGYALKSDVPIKLSELTNDSGFITKNVTDLVNYYKKTEVYSKNEIDAKKYLTEHQDLSAYAKTSQIPTKVSQLTNDSKFLTAIPNEYVTESELEGKGYLTQHQDLSSYAKKSTTLAGYGITDAATKTELNKLDNEKIGQTELTNEVASALQTAKDSGTFDGQDGNDGVSCTHSWNGTTLTITSASGSSSANLKGDKGDKGDKGVSGVYVGSGSMPSGYNIQIDPEGDADYGDIVTREEFGRLEETIADQYEKNPLWGKKVSFLGDSICAGSDSATSYLGGYGKIIADRNNMAYQNLGKGGATVTAETYSSTTGYAKGWLCRMVENMDADADYAIIEGGVNDAWQMVDHDTITIGKISNGYNATLDDTTYYGAFESMLKKLITRFQGKKIGYIAIPKTMEFYDSNRNVPNFYHIALECCAKWGVPVCDLNVITPSSECLGTDFVPDGTHPNLEGYLKYYCDPIEAWMKTLTTGGNNAVSVAMQAIEEYTKGFNDAIKALQDGKLDNTGVSFRKALLPLADGTTLEIDVLTAVDGTVIIKYVNQVPISIDTDKSVFNGVGYIGDTRLSSSGVTKTQLGCYTTGYIPVKNGDVIRIFECDWANTKNSNSYICAYNSNFGFLGACASTAGSSNLTDYTATIYKDYSKDVDMNATLTLNVPNVAYIRISSKGNTSENEPTFDPKDMIVTVNEEIK